MPGGHGLIARSREGAREEGAGEEEEEGAGALDRPPYAGPQHPVPHLRRLDGRAPAEGADRGVLRPYLGEQEGADFRDAYWRRRNHAPGPQPSEARPQRAVTGSPDAAAHKVQVRRVRIPRLPQRRGAVPPPGRRRLPGEGQPWSRAGEPEPAEHWQERSAH